MTPPSNESDTADITYRHPSYLSLRLRAIRPEPRDGVPRQMKHSLSSDLAWSNRVLVVALVAMTTSWSKSSYGGSPASRLKGLIRRSLVWTADRLSRQGFCGWQDDRERKKWVNERAGFIDRERRRYRGF
jgi:hypothetical protein